MRSRELALAASLLALLGVAGCGGDDEDSETGTVAETATEVTGTATAADGGGAEGISIKTADSQFGRVLFDGEEQAIYYFDKETSAKPDCYGACAEAWPPVLSEGPPQAGGGIDAAKLGTTMRRDGSTQVTYAGRPLYYYAHEGPGEVTCHNVDEFGGLWLAVQPNGEPVPS